MGKSDPILKVSKQYSLTDHYHFHCCIEVEWSVWISHPIKSYSLNKDVFTFRYTFKTFWVTKPVVPG